MDLSIVVPLFNEEKSIIELHNQIKQTLHSMNYNYELIFVEDGSFDKSYQKLCELFNENENIKVIRLRKNFGKSSALYCGFKKAKGDIIITMDADLQDLPREIPKLIEKLNDEDLDLVSGWRVKRCDSISKKFLSLLFNKITYWLTGIKLHDFNCGLKVYRKEVIDDLNIYGELHRYLPVLAQRRGFKVGEVKIAHAHRKWDRSKYGTKRLLSGFFDLLTILFITKFERRPLHLFGFIGTILLLIGLIISLYFAAQWLTGTPMHIRPMIVFGWIMVILGVHFISIGFLGDMINSTNKSTLHCSIKNILE